MQIYTAEELIAYENYIKNLFELGFINTPVHLSGGNEDQLIEVFEDIQAHDYVFSTHRSHYHYLLKGGCPYALTEELLGESTGMCRGQGRSMHLYDPDINFYTSAIVGGICAMAVGVGMGIVRKTRGKRWKVPHVWCFIGDGGEDTGHFMEAQRYAFSHDLPVTFVIEDNDLAVETTRVQRWGKNDVKEYPNVYRYEYVRKYPHVGIGHYVSM